MLVAFSGRRCAPQFLKFENGQILIRLVYRDEVVIRATSASDRVTLKDDQVLVKSYGENAGVYEALINSGLVYPYVNKVSAGHDFLLKCHLTTEGKKMQRDWNEVRFYRGRPL